MKDYVSLWLDGRSARRPRAISAPVSVSGKFDKHLGGTYQRARIELEVEPSSSFEVVDESQLDEEVRGYGYLDSAVFGLLDVLMLVEPQPICNVRVVVTDIGYDPIDSSQMAFRHAGRDAGQRILESIGEKMGFGDTGAQPQAKSL